MIADFKHSGQLGDIVYAIPAMKALARKYDADKIRLFIPKDKIAKHHPGLKHIGGDFMVSTGMFEYIKPLLAGQACFADIVFVEEALIPATAADCDVIRSGALNLSASTIRDYYFKAFGLLAEDIGPWLQPTFEGRRNGNFDLVIGRSTRYLNLAINYGIVDQLQLRVGFIGMEREFAEFSSRHPQMKIEYARTANAMEACNLIASAPFYIGNQSFFFAIAEALQTPRLLEVFEPVPNVVPMGGKRGQFVNTQGFGALLSAFYSRDVQVPSEPLSFESRYVLSV